MRVFLRAMVLLWFACCSRAQNHPAETEIPHPMISTNADWMVITLILAAAIFIAAMIAGPIIRANTKEEETPRR